MSLSVTMPTGSSSWVTKTLPTPLSLISFAASQALCLFRSLLALFPYTCLLGHQEDFLLRSNQSKRRLERCILCKCQVGFLGRRSHHIDSISTSANSCIPSLELLDIIKQFVKCRECAVKGGVSSSRF